MRPRHLLLIMWTALALACCVRGAFAQDDAEVFGKITLRQIMGTNWPEFERAFAALASDARNDDAFREMSVIVGEAGALNKMAPYLETLVKARPDDATLRTILGRVYKDLLRDPTKARAHFEAVLQKDPNDFFVHYQIASLFAREGAERFDNAVTHYRAAASAKGIDRQYPELRTRILTELGALLYSRREADPKNVQEAFDAWDAMTSGVREYDLVTYEQLADEYRARSIWNKVEATWERYLKVNEAPDAVTRCRIKTRIGEARENQARYDQAVDAYRDAIALLDENTWQRRQLETRVQTCYERMNRLVDLESTLSQAVADDVNSVPARQTLARMLEKAGRLDEAAALLEEARKMAPKNVPVLNALQRIYRQSRRDDALADVLRARIALSSEDLDAYVDLAEVHVRRGETGDAEKVLAELESSPSERQEKFLLLARAYARYGLYKRSFLLYKRLVDEGSASAEVRFEFCDFCLAHDDLAAAADEQARSLTDGGTLDADGYVRLSDVFRKFGKNETALAVLLRGISARAKRPDGADDRAAAFTLNTALSDLAHRMGEGHHAQAIGATLRALLAAPELHFKRRLNDRLVTLLVNYGHRDKLLYAEAERAKDPGLFGGPNGRGVAPWVDFLNVQANSREEADLWMLLGQIHETVEVDAELPAKPGTAEAAVRPVKTSIAQARLCYQKVVDMEFQNLDAHLALARVLADPAVDEYEVAVNEFEVLSVLNPVTRWESIQTIGDLYADAGETALARAKWREVAEQSASEPNLLAQIAMRMYRADDLDLAVKLAEEARTISPHVFRYRVMVAYLVARAAALRGDVDLYARHVDEMTEALKLAQASPELADFVPRVKQGLFEGRTDLAKRYFERGKFREAKTVFTAAADLLKSGAEGDPRITDAEVQAARCDEALGDRAGAMRRYEDLLKDKPDVPCWVSAGVTVSARGFLALKRDGKLVEGAPVARPAPAGETVDARPVGSVQLHAAVRAFLATADGRLRVEGTYRRFHLDASAGKLVGSDAREAALEAGPVTVLPAGANRAVIVTVDGIKAIDPETGKVLWSTPASQLKDVGRVETILATDHVVAVGGSKGLLVLGASDGGELWHRAGDWMTCDLDGRTVALLTSAPRRARGLEPVETASGGTRELLTLDAATGKVIARASVSASTLWQAPVIAGDLVLLADSFDGSVMAFDVRTGRERCTFDLKTALIRPITVVGDAAIVHTLRDGAVHVAALDLVRLSVRYDVPLVSGEHAVQGLVRQPLVWRERLLYVDGRTGALVVLDTRTGKVHTSGSLGTLRSGLRWTLAGDTLCLIDDGGGVRFVRLDVRK